MLDAAGVASVMLHLRDIVLHVLWYFRHDPARMNEYSNFGHLGSFGSRNRRQFAHLWGEGEITSGM